MKMNPLSLSRSFLCLLLCLLLFIACGPKRLPPDEPPIEPRTQPEEKEPDRKEPDRKEPDVTPPAEPEEPGKPPKEALPAPPIKPRAPARGDTASTKLLDSGVKQMNAGNLEEAEQLFEQALRVSPTNGKPYYYLGVLSAKQGNYDRSLSFLEQAEGYLHDDPFWMSQVLMQEGLALKSLNRKAEAREKFQEALKLDPSNQHAAKELKALQ
jgi:Tfp pilus assembly protein PilF